MILLCGIASEPPIAMIIEQLKLLDAPFLLFNQRRFNETEVEFEIKNNKITGKLEINNDVYPLEDFQGVYTRLMDFRYLPELKDERPDTPKYLHCQKLHNTLVSWMQIAPVRVISRPEAMGSNSSKPYQAQLIRENGFKVPETLITNDPGFVREFLKHHKRIIYKSISSIRSIVQTFRDEDISRLDLIRWCPVQFQEFVEGLNVRIHVVGTEVFATQICSEATDYRYPNSLQETKLKVFNLSKELSRKCIKLSRALDLEVSGIDLKISQNNEVYCFEVNPGPAFSFYEENTGQPIARAIASHLMGYN